MLFKRKPKIYRVYYKDDYGDGLDVKEFNTLDEAREDIKYNASLAAFGLIYKCNIDNTHEKFIEQVETIKKETPPNKN